MTLHLLQGPAGSGKSQLARDMKHAGQVDLLADVTALWAAVGVYDRGPDGRYPVRDDDDPALLAALYLQTTLVTYGLERGLNVAATTSRRDQVGRWQTLAASLGADFNVQTIDPGIDVVSERLTDPDTGKLSEECAKAINRWYS